MSHIFTVTEFTRALKEVLEAGFPLVKVRGQVVNLAKPASGHVYFGLADAKAVLPVVWFKSSQWSRSRRGERVNPATGEVEEAGTPAYGPAELQEGDEIIAAGRITVYEQRGAYQLVAEMVQAVGVGGAHQALEALKRKLEAEGLFDASRRRPFPRNPRCVAVVTSPTGAAIQDFLRVGESRGLGGEVRIHPTVVQGDAAPASIVQALDRAGSDAAAEVVVLIRGGGAAEDLSAFNAEEVVRAVAGCPLPVVAGIGHEVDWTLAGMAADWRASTPSNAAQAVWPERDELRQAVDDLELKLRRAFESRLDARAARLESLAGKLRLLSPAGRLARLESRFTDFRGRLAASWERFVHLRLERVERRRESLAKAFGERRIEKRVHRAESLARRLDRAWRGGLDRRRDLVAGLSRALEGLDPQRPLRRGFCLVEVEGRPGYLRTAQEASPGDLLRIRPASGEVLARVEASREKESDV
jgi:exodeoxyribonuclease VII large subunit